MTCGSHPGGGVTGRHPLRGGAGSAPSSQADLTPGAYQAPQVKRLEAAAAASSAPGLQQRLRQIKVSQMGIVLI